MFLAKKAVLLMGLEATYGTDPTLDATNAIYAMNLSITPMAGSTADRNRAWPTLGADAKVHVGTNATLSFDVELAGSGTAGTPPLYGPCLRACGLDETITAATSVAYAPVSTGQESAAIHFNMDGRRHVLLGARGTMSLKMSGNSVPMLNFQMTGLFAAGTDTAIPAGIAAQLKEFQDGLEANKVNTPTFTVHGYSPVVESLQLDLGNKVIFRDRPGAAKIAITDRQGGGNLSIELPPISGKDFMSIAKANTLGALSVVHGTAAGNIVTCGAPKLQLLQPTYADVDGIYHISANLVLARDSGDDEFTLTYT